MLPRQNARQRDSHLTATRRDAMDSREPTMAMRDITTLMNAYRECARNLWNVYFSGRQDVGVSLDAFGQLRESLFDAIVLSELFFDDVSEGEDMPPPALRVVPRERSIILVERPSGPGEAGYWDQERDLVVGPNDIELAFVDYFDFAQIPVMDFRFYRCKILRFPSRSQYEGREALINAVDGHVFHDESQ
jgi:hypothetical protein